MTESPDSRETGTHQRKPVTSAARNVIAMLRCIEAGGLQRYRHDDHRIRIFFTPAHHN